MPSKDIRVASTLILFCLFLSQSVRSQNPVCTNGQFYGIESYYIGHESYVYSFTLSDTGVIYNGAVTKADTTQLPGALAIADLGAGPSFYSTSFSDSSYGNTILQYNDASSAWQIIFSNTEGHFNAGGNGSYLFFQGNPNNTLTNNIQRFDGDTLITIWNYYPKYSSSMQDIAVDNNGNVYFLTSDGNPFQANRLKIISPDGVLLKDFPIDLNTLNAYGCFLQGNVFYIGLGQSNGIYPNKLIPFTITSDSAEMGIPIDMATPVVTTAYGQNVLQLADLASCTSSNIIIPVSFKSVNAQLRGNEIEVEWEVANELNIRKYVVQKSFDGKNFNDVNIQPSKGNAFSNSYKWLDESIVEKNNFYRIKSYADNGFVGYSQIAKVSNEESEDISIYPNPVTDNNLLLHLHMIEPGIFHLRIANEFGQTVQENNISTHNSDETIKVQLTNSLAKGLYTLQVTSPKKIISSIKLLVQ